MKEDKAVFHDRTGEVHMDFHIGDFLNVEVDKKRMILTISAKAVVGDPWNGDFRAELISKFGLSSAERMLEDASYQLMKSQVLETLRK